jgi:hypothetical protein
VFGENAHQKFQNESGGIRWQRIPPTEHNERYQTSTITVAVLMPSNNSININNQGMSFTFKDTVVPDPIVGVDSGLQIINHAHDYKPLSFFKSTEATMAFSPEDVLTIHADVSIDGNLTVSARLNADSVHSVCGISAPRFWGSAFSDSINTRALVVNGSKFDSIKTYNPTVRGWDGTPGTTVYYRQQGKYIFISYDIYGTSNADTCTFTLPIANNSTFSIYNCSNYGLDNSNELSAPGLILVVGNNVKIYKD